MDINRVLLFPIGNDNQWLVAFCAGPFESSQLAQAAAKKMYERQIYMMHRFEQEYEDFLEEADEPKTMFDSILRSIQEEIEEKK